MAAGDVTVGIIFLLQIVLGILGNSSLLCHHLFLHLSGCRSKPTNTILKHLTLGNILTLLCRGIPQTMVALGFKVSLSDSGCKLLFYLHRVGRSVSIGSTCLLSVFQAITISSRDSRWAELKGHRYIGSSIHLCWILSIPVNLLFLVYMSGNSSNKNITGLKDFGYCSSVRQDRTSDTLFAVLLSVPDVVCVELMFWASTSMVFILYRHKQRLQHIHKTLSPRSSPETRATKTILLLVSTFVFFYLLSCIFQVCLAAVYNPSFFLVNTAAIVNACFPTVSPFLLTSGAPSTFRPVCLDRRRKVII